MKKLGKYRIKAFICLYTMIIGTLSSCNLEKKLVYFQDSHDGEILDSYRGYTPKFKADDVLSILVTADDPISAQPFNIEISANANIRGNSGYSTGAPAQGYLIDSLGLVNMPVIGKMKLAGLNRIEATALLEKELETYLSNPVVQIRIVNFKVTVLGEVERPGTFSIPNERITILEAIGLAGDLKITGKRENIKVIRNENGKQHQHIIDLTSKNSFQSPVYYLEQNDVVYIEPNKSQRTQSTFWVRSGALIVSVSSLIISTIAVVTKQLKLNQDKKSTEEFESFDIRKVFEFLKSYWRQIVLSVLLFSASAYVYVRYTTSKYRSTAKILIQGDNEKSGLGNFQFDALGIVGQSIGAESEVEILKSRQLLSRVVEKLHLTTTVYSYGGLTKIKRAELYTTESPFWIESAQISDEYFEPISITVKHDEKNNFNLEFGDGEKISVKNGDFFTHQGIKLKIYLNPNTVIKNNKQFDVIISSKDEVISRLRGLIKIDNEQINEGIIGISLDGFSSNKNNAILNELIAQHQQLTIEQKNNIAVKTNKFLVSRLTSIESKLDSIEDLGRQIRATNGIIDVSTEFPALLIEERQLEEELFDLSVNEALAQQLIEFLNSDEDYQSLIPVNIGFQSTSLSTSIADYNQLVLERNNLLSSSSENNPLVIKRKNDIVRLRANLKKSIESYRTSVGDQKKRVLSKLSSFSSKKSSIPKYELDYKDIMRDQQIRESIYLLLLQKKEENEIILASTESNIRVIDYAYSDPRPVAPNKKLLFTLAVILGIVLPITYFYLKGLFNNKLKNIQDVEKYGLPVVGEVPIHDGDVHDLIYKTTRNPVTECFVSIRTNIGFLLNNKSKNVILVTSTIAGEGKTFVTLNLAKSLGNSGKKVVVVGLDLRLPKLLEYIDLPYTIGVSDFISNDKYTVENITYKHDLINGVEFIPCGTIPPNPSELLLRERFTLLIESLKEKYDIVLIDTSPIGLVADTLSISKIADLLVYVARVNHLNTDLLEIPKKLYNENQFKSMTMLLNGSELKSIGYGYGYQETTSKKKTLIDWFRLKKK